jgi:hypothetical protein
MTLNLPLLLLALVLLWLPRPWLRLGATLLKRRRRRVPGGGKEPWNTREPGDPRVSARQEFTHIRNYIDFLRALGGTALVLGGWQLQASIGAAAGASKLVTREVLVVKAAILLIGVLVQTHRWNRQRITFYPPIFYLAGISFVLVSPWPALFAFVMIWAVNPALGNAQAFLSLYAVFVATFGYLLSKSARAAVIYLAGLIFLPVLLSLLSKRPLVVFARKTTHAGGG